MTEDDPQKRAHLEDVLLALRRYKEVQSEWTCAYDWLWYYIMEWYNAHSECWLASSPNLSRLWANSSVFSRIVLVHGNLLMPSTFCISPALPWDPPQCVPRLTLTDTWSCTNCLLRWSTWNLLHNSWFTEKVSVLGHEGGLTKNLFQKVRIHGLVRGVLPKWHLKAQPIPLIFIFGSFSLLLWALMAVGYELESLSHAEFSHFLFCFL